jgi:hypothetical protein
LPAWNEAQGNEGCSLDTAGSRSTARRAAPPGSYAPATRSPRRPG